jgi:hypothetical protein
MNGTASGGTWSPAATNVYTLDPRSGQGMKVFTEMVTFSGASANSMAGPRSGFSIDGRLLRRDPKSPYDPRPRTTLNAAGHKAHVHGTGEQSRRPLSTSRFLKN